MVVRACSSYQAAVFVGAMAIATAHAVKLFFKCTPLSTIFNNSFRFYESDKNNRFCNFCGQREHAWLDFRPGRIDTNAVAKMECWFQRLVYQVLLDFIDSDDIEVHTLSAAEDDQLCQLRYWASKDNGSIYLLGPYSTSSTTNLTDFPLKLTCVLSGASVENRLAVAGRWVQHCVSSHLECGRPTTTEFQGPSRLLDLSESHSTGLVRLVENRLRMVQYATLSYCWGHDSPPKATKSTIAHMVNGIRLIDLPPTFKDAIQVCNALGIRFLWIDSVCILQDDQWATQVPA